MFEFPIKIIAGSESDKKIIQDSGMLDIFKEIGVRGNLSIISAHRNPEELRNYCLKTEEETLVYIAIAGASAALAGVISAHIKGGRPVIGVPLDKIALKSMGYMPKGIPVAIASGVEKNRLYNAALIACQIVANNDEIIRKKLKKYLISSAKSAQIEIESF